MRFDRLLCEGGIEVSAVRSEGATTGVKLEAARDSHVRLQNPFGADGGYVCRRLLKPNPEGDLELQLKAGEPVWVTASDGTDLGDLEEFAVARCESEQNPYGMKYLEDDLFLEDFLDFEREKD